MYLNLHEFKNPKIYLSICIRKWQLVKRKKETFYYLRTFSLKHCQILIPHMKGYAMLELTLLSWPSALHVCDTVTVCGNWHQYVGKFHSCTQRNPHGPPWWLKREKQMQHPLCMFKYTILNIIPITVVQQLNIEVLHSCPNIVDLYCLIKLIFDLQT